MDLCFLLKVNSDDMNGLILRTSFDDFFLEHIPEKGPKRSPTRRLLTNSKLYNIGGTLAVFERNLLLGNKMRPAYTPPMYSKINSP